MTENYDRNVKQTFKFHPFNEKSNSKHFSLFIFELLQSWFINIVLNILNLLVNANKTSGFTGCIFSRLSVCLCPIDYCFRSEEGEFLYLH